MSSTLSFRLPRTVGSRRTALLLVSVIAAVILLLYKSGLICLTAIYGGHNNEAPAFMLTQKKFIVGSDKKIYEYNRNMPLIFIGGVPRSGTTLMRAMLDAHPDVRCGQETRVIPRLLMISRHWVAYEKESVRLEQAGISRDVLDEAVASFCLEIIARHGEPAPRLCNKDPFTLNVGTYLLELFPQSKFIFMVRDGRATVHSIISRKVTITGFDLNDYRQCMVTWNRAAQRMYAQCEVLGAHRCMRVPYEQLVLHPRAWMTRILRFLDVAWNESVLHHEQFVNKPNGILLSKVERSSDQVIKPVNLEALSKWVGQFPESVVHDMAKLAPMLQVLGYDPNANPPNYGSPDSQVVDNTRQVNAESDKWKQRVNQLLRKDATASDYHDQLDKMFLGDVTDTPEVA